MVKRQRKKYSKSLYYRPGDPSYRVVAENRTEFLIYVCKQHPDVLERFATDVSPLFKEVWPYPTKYSTLAVDIETLYIYRQFVSHYENDKERNYLIDELGKCYEAAASHFKRTSSEKMLEMEQAISDAAEHVALRLPLVEHRHESVEIISDFYFSTFLHKLGSWSFEQILRFDGLCKKAQFDFVTEPEALWMIHQGTNLSYLMRDLDLLPKFTFRILTTREYWELLDNIEAYKNLPFDECPSWIYDESNDQYVCYQMPPDLENAKDLHTRTSDTFSNAFFHFSKRREKFLTDSALVSFSSKRNVEHFQWLYQALILNLDEKDIIGDVGDKDIYGDSVTKAIGETAKLLGIELKNELENYPSSNKHLKILLEVFRRK